MYTDLLIITFNHVVLLSNGNQDRLIFLRASDKDIQTLPPWFVSTRNTSCFFCNPYWKYLMGVFADFLIVPIWEGE
jgi:hypothetical protein